MSIPNTDKQLAIFLTKICKQTYVQYRNDECSLPNGYELVTTLRGTPCPGRPPEVIGLIAQSTERIVIAFRGSQTASEWLADFKYAQVAWPYSSAAGSVHSGFLSIYDSCRAQILATLRTLPTTSALLITGHSLGGALATCCALDLAVNTPFSQPILYTFGSPRVGSWKFAKTHEKTVTHSRRIVVRADFVPTQPPVLFFSNPPFQLVFYSHIGQEVTLDVDGGTMKQDHDLDTYLKGLSNLPEA